MQRLRNYRSNDSYEEDGTQKLIPHVKRGWLKRNQKKGQNIVNDIEEISNRILWMTLKK